MTLEVGRQPAHSVKCQVGRQPTDLRTQVGAGSAYGRQLQVARTETLPPQLPMIATLARHEPRRH